MNKENIETTIYDIIDKYQKIYFKRFKNIIMTSETCEEAYLRKKLLENVKTEQDIILDEYNNNKISENEYKTRLMVLQLQHDRVTTIF